MSAHSFRTALLRVSLLAGVIIPVPAYAQTNPGLGSEAIADSVHRAVRTNGLEASAPARALSGDTLRGPLMAPAALVASHWTLPRDAAPLPRDPGANIGPNLALVGVGAAAVVVGLLIGGDGGHAVALGGGVLGLIGLYRYLR